MSYLIKRFSPVLLTTLTVLSLYSHAASFSGSGVNFTVHGIMSGSAFMSSCQVRNSSSFDDLWLKDTCYGVSNDVFPSQLLIAVSKKTSGLTSGGVISVCLPSLNKKANRFLDFLASEPIPQMFIFWEKDGFGRFQIGQDYPLLGRKLLSYTPLFQYDSFSGNYSSLIGRLVSLRSYDRISYRTPDIKGFVAEFGFGDSSRLLSSLYDTSHFIAYLPSFSSGFSYENPVFSVWTTYFSQSLRQRHYLMETSGPMLSATTKEVGAIIGPRDKDGFSFVLDYQRGNALSFVSDAFSTDKFIPQDPQLSDGLLDIESLFVGSGYRLGSKRFFISYQKVEIFDSLPKRALGFSLAMTYKINTNLLLFSRASILNLKNYVIDKDQVYAVNLGFIFKF